MVEPPDLQTKTLNWWRNKSVACTMTQGTGLRGREAGVFNHLCRSRSIIVGLREWLFYWQNTWRGYKHMGTFLICNIKFIIDSSMEFTKTWMSQNPNSTFWVCSWIMCEFFRRHIHLCKCWIFFTNATTTNCTTIPIRQYFYLSFPSFFLKNK